MIEHEWAKGVPEGTVILDGAQISEEYCPRCLLSRMKSSYLTNGEASWAYFLDGDIMLGDVPTCNDVLMRRVLG